MLTLNSNGPRKYLIHEGGKNIWRQDNLVSKKSVESFKQYLLTKKPFWLQQIEDNKSDVEDSDVKSISSDMEEEIAPKRKARKVIAREKKSSPLRLRSPDRTPSPSPVRLDHLEFNPILKRSPPKQHPQTPNNKEPQSDSFFASLKSFFFQQKELTSRPNEIPLKIVDLESNTASEVDWTTQEG